MVLPNPVNVNVTSFQPSFSDVFVLTLYFLIAQVLIGVVAFAGLFVLSATLGFALFD